MITKSKCSMMLKNNPRRYGLFGAFFEIWIWTSCSRPLLYFVCRGGSLPEEEDAAGDGPRPPAGDQVGAWAMESGWMKPCFRCWPNFGSVVFCKKIQPMSVRRNSWVECMTTFVCGVVLISIIHNVIPPPVPAVGQFGEWKKLGKWLPCWIGFRIEHTFVGPSRTYGRHWSSKK